MSVLIITSTCYNCVCYTFLRQCFSLYQWRQFSSNLRMKFMP